MTDPGPRPSGERPPLPARLLRYGAREGRRFHHEVQTRLRPAQARARGAAQVVRRPREASVTGQEGRELEHQWQWSACYAPLTSMYLDQFGQARACCQNTGHLLGDVRTSTLREIWDGAAATELRTALGRGDLALGCEFCAWQSSEVEPRAWFLRHYDQYPAGWSSQPRWPRQLEFAVSNTCNLQCVMCNGDWSSSIRSRREHRPPLPSAYPERFYDELRVFIPHLSNARFTGGEPFLGTEPQRIMDLLGEHGHPDLAMNVVTNGTIFNDRVERTLGRIRSRITISLDGGTKEAYERVRVGASFEQVLGNLDRFAAIVATRGEEVNLTHCLMVDNWETFPDLLLLAEERQLEVAINTVRFPERHSLHHLPPAELKEVVDALDRRTASLEAAVTGNRLTVWHEQLDFLRTRATSPHWPQALGVAHEPASTEIPVSLGSTRPRQP